MRKRQRKSLSRNGGLPRLLTTQVVAQLVGITPSTVRSAIHYRRLVPVGALVRSAGGRPEHLFRPQEVREVWPAFRSRVE